MSAKPKKVTLFHPKGEHLGGSVHSKYQTYTDKNAYDERTNAKSQQQQKKNLLSIYCR